MDPFKPLSDAEREALGDVLSDLHLTFKAAVAERRGARLKGDREALFSGARARPRPLLFRKTLRSACCARARAQERR